MGRAHKCPPPPAHCGGKQAAATRFSSRTIAHHQMLPVKSCAHLLLLVEPPDAGGVPLELSVGKGAQIDVPSPCHTTDERVRRLGRARVKIHQLRHEVSAPLLSCSIGVQSRCTCLREASMTLLTHAREAFGQEWVDRPGHRHTTALRATIDTQGVYD